MRERSISSIGVVAAVVIPALFGGPIWAIAIACFATIGMREYYRLIESTGISPLQVAYLAVFISCLVAALGLSWDLALLSIGVSMIAASLVVLRRNNAPGSLVEWGMDIAGAVYLAAPAYLAIELRRIDGEVNASWLASLADALSLSWTSYERGLSWLLFVITVTWLSDTGAYLLGRQFGRTPLVPGISPKKTREGLIGGMISALAFGLVANVVFGLDLPVLAAAGIAVLLVVLGVYGDLTESLLKRQANVKDSGTLIPGHGGMLDRIDALLFTWTAGFFIALLADRIWA